MKQSKYNHLISLEGKTYMMNGLTEKFFVIPDGRQETYRELLDNPNLDAEDFSTFYTKMRDGALYWRILF